LLDGIWFAPALVCRSVNGYFAARATSSKDSDRVGQYSSATAKIDKTGKIGRVPAGTFSKTFHNTGPS